MPISYKNKIYTTLGTPTSVYGSVFSVTNSSGVPVKDYTVKGETIVWNQLRTNQTSSGSGSTSVQYAKIGSAETSLVYGHKYYVRFYVKYGAGNTNDSSVGFKLGNFGYAEFSMAFFPTDSFVLQEQISTLNSSAGAGENRSGFIKYSDSSKVLSIEWKNLQIFDLTQMFGVGNEPETPSEFRAMFPDDYYPYNAGELKSIMPTSIEASGIERFQLLDKNKYPATTTSSGVTFTNNGDGSITVDGTAGSTANGYFNVAKNLSVIQGHKYYATMSKPIEHNNFWLGLYAISGDAPFNNGTILDRNGQILTCVTSSDKLYVDINLYKNTSVSNATVKPQLFDLTQMFGAGNEPATPAEFWQKIPEKLYGYNPSAYKSVNIPSSKYFPDGMRSAGSAYDEINFLSQKAIKRVGVRAYQTGDENDANVMTDKINTVYILSTPIETTITPPLQALSTFKGFTSFSAPNSLTQNGPLSVTYYAEGGTSSEKGWLTSYKRKLYMGRNIEWNQLLGRTNRARVTNNGVTVELKDDGSYVVNGTATDTVIIQLETSNFSTVTGHKYFVTGCPKNGSMKTFRMSDAWSGQYTDFGDGVIFVASVGKVTSNSIAVTSGYTCTNLIYKPQLFNLTKMFGAGNEPTTPAEFWSYFDHKLYPYNPGETQPLFKISRKSYIYKEPAGYTVYFVETIWIADTVTISVEYADGSTETLTSQNDMGGKSRNNVVKMTFTDTDSDRYVTYRMPANGGSEETLHLLPTATLVLTADAEIWAIEK